jgi:hypothetical protein
MHAHAKIADIADTFTGYSFRDTSQVKSAGAVGVCQMKDLEDQEYAIRRVQGYTDLPYINLKHVLLPTDLLFLAKGQRSYAVRVAVAPAVRLIAASAFIVIRPDVGKVDPDFLTWYINGPDAQAWLKAKGQGSTVQAVSIAVLQNLPIVLPALPEQEAFGRLGVLGLREYILSVQLARKKYELLNQQIQKMVAR